VYSGFTDAHLNAPADFWGPRTNKMFVLTQVGNHDALHYGNLVTYLRINGLEPSTGDFDGAAASLLSRSGRRPWLSLRHHVLSRISKDLEKESVVGDIR
jgi:hypothetical protein